MALTESVIQGVTLGAMGVLGLLALYYVITLTRLVVNGVSLERAIPRSAGRVYGYILAALTLVGMVITQGVQVADIFASAIASAPLFATNVMTAFLGWLGIRGTIDTVTMVVAAAAFVAFAFILREADARGSR